MTEPLPAPPEPASGKGPAPDARPGRGRAPIVPIGSVRWRQHARVLGRVRSMRVQPWANVASLECVIFDDSGGLVVVFLGRRKVAGIDLGRELVAEGVVGEHRGYLGMLNPEIELLPEGPAGGLPAPRRHPSAPWRRSGRR